MLIPDFYTVQKINVEGESIEAEVRLNPEHEVYDGHFPEQPVVPGVIQLQMVKEILESVLQEELFLDTVGTAKYLKMIIPKEDLRLHISIQYKQSDTGDFKINALISSDEMLFTKLKAGLRKK